MKIGLSLSRCVTDILEERVSINDVAVIITNTRAYDDRSWRRLIHLYFDLEWKDHAGRRTYVEALIDRLRKDGLIVQPRLNNPEHEHGISNGHWIEL